MANAQFEQQVLQIRKNYEVIGLDEVQRRVRWKQSFRPAAAITFDDGYADNAGFALPLLVKLRLPCTYFVSVDNIRDGLPFPHDVQHGQPLKPNSVDELRHWSNAGIEIGLHTRTHFDFSQGDDDAIIEREILSARDELQEMIGRPVRYFAFPYGMPEQLSLRAISAIHEAGMSGFCSAYGAYNVPGRDDFHIRRIHGDSENERFENWLYFDQRKLNSEPRIESKTVGDSVEPEHEQDAAIC